MCGKAHQLSKFNFFGRKLLAVINESYGEREKCVGGSFTPKVTAMSRAKGGIYKRKKHNMKRRSGYPMTMRSQDPEGRKEGP